jgi:hypothetical protein
VRKQQRELIEKQQKDIIEIQHKEHQQKLLHSESNPRQKIGEKENIHSDKQQQKLLHSESNPRAHDSSDVNTSKSDNNFKQVTPKKQKRTSLKIGVLLIYYITKLSCLLNLLIN